MTESNYTMRKLVASDIFAMSRILKKMDIKGEMKLDEGMTQEEYGQKFLLTIVENISNAEEEFNKFFSSLIGVTEDEFSNIDIDEMFGLYEQFKEQGGIQRFLKLIK